MKKSDTAATEHYLDKRVTETAERLIEIYKQEFGVDWQQAYCRTVSLLLHQT